VKEDRQLFWIASLLFGLDFAWSLHQVGWSGIRWTGPAFFLPFILLLIGFINGRIRFRSLGFLVMLAAMLCLVLVGTAFIEQGHYRPNISWILYLKTAGMYGAMILAGYYQLRFRPD